MLTLTARSFRRVLAVLAALVAVLIVFQVVIVVVAASFESSRSFERIATLVPGFVTRSFASSLLTLASFRAMSVAGYFHPVILLIVTGFAIYIGSEPAGDVERGLVDVVLARALPRRYLVSRSLAVVVLATVGLALALGVGTAAGLATFAPAGAFWPQPRTIGVLTIELLLVAWTFGAWGAAAAAFARRRAAAVGIVGVIAVALYLLEFLGASWAPAAPFARVSPFHYYDGTGILVGRGDLATDAAVLAAMIGAGVATAYWQFARRDL